MNSIIIVAAGLGSRMKCGKNKLLLDDGLHTLIWYTLKNIFSSRLLDEAVLVVKEEEKSYFRSILASLPAAFPVYFAPGGATRFESVRNGLKMVSRNSDKLLIHDGARPLVDGRAVDSMIRFLDAGHPSAIFALPCVDTIKWADGNEVDHTMKRQYLYRAQTPQGFLTGLYREAVEKLPPDAVVTDDASVAEYSHIPVSILPGRESYFKVTTPEDWKRFVMMIKKREPCPLRIGQGYDIHRFAKERPLILGGIQISETDGLLGHSDADVLIHAIMDSLLGAAGLPDIGHYFPDTDDRFKGASSAVLLKEVTKIISHSGYRIVNIDSTIIAEKPKVAPFIPEMKNKLAASLDISPGQIGIKATTNEKLGAIGRAEGMAALASAILIRRE